jgi:hypothetical protein
MGMLALMMFCTTIISVVVFYILYKWMLRDFEKEKNQ